MCDSRFCHTLSEALTAYLEAGIHQRRVSMTAGPNQTHGRNGVTGHTVAATSKAAPLTAHTTHPTPPAAAHAPASPDPN